MIYPEIIEQRKRDKTAEQLRMWRSIRDYHRSVSQDSHALIKIEIHIAAIKAYRYALKLFGDASAGG
jgi:hypothetical protein